MPFILRGIRRDTAGAITGRVVVDVNHYKSGLEPGSSLTLARC